jgi:hypothetical protein
MPMLPKVEDSPVVRTTFDDEAAWNKVCALIQQPVSDGAGGEFRAYVAFIDDVAFRNLSGDELLERVPEDFGHSFLMVVDAATVGSAEYPILVIDLYDERRRRFRAIPSQIQSIENNLSIANMDFADFADCADEDGVFREFPEALS